MNEDERRLFAEIETTLVRERVGRSTLGWRGALTRVERSWVWWLVVALGLVVEVLALGLGEPGAVVVGVVAWAVMVGAALRSWSVLERGR